MASRKERKVVTVVFADLVGFTSRAESLDPEDVHAILGPYHARLRHELERYGGTVEKFIGDAVMAVFGAPVVHEDDAERAVRAALAIRDWAREEDDVEVRIAVNTGEALVSVEARPEVGEAMVAGDVVNTAARLQSAAPVNGILVGEATHRATERAIDYAGAEPVEAKGKAEPVAAWEVVAARSRLGVDLGGEGGVSLVGRDRELELLHGALGRVRAEAAPHLVTLVGVPGIGKSRLVRELFRLADAEPELISWRQGRSLPYGEGVAFWAFAEMVKAHAGILDGDPPEEVDAKLRRAVEGAVDEGEAGWVESNLRPLVGLAGDGDARGDDRAEAFAAWRLFVEGIAEKAPLVLVFEDLHWADDGLLDFIDHLVDWVSGVPLLLVCTARPELLARRPGWGGGKLNATTVSLSPLSADETARMIHALLDQAVLPADVQAMLLERAGGNPLYAEEFARTALVRGVDASAAGLPESVQGLIAARVDGLSPDEKAVLEHAAVVGKVFWGGAVRALGANGSLDTSLHSLERKEFVQRERRSAVGGDNQYAFRHSLVRDVAYGQIPRARRAELHRLAAEWIEALGRPEERAELLAFHYEEALELARASGQDTGQLTVRARIALRDAGARAMALSAAAAAVQFYRGGLDLWPDDDPERPELLLALGRAEEPVDEPSAVDTLAAASDGLLALGRRDLAAEAQVLLADLRWRHAESEQAWAGLNRAAELVADAPVSRSKAFVTGQISRFHMLAGRGDEAIRFGSEALAMADELGLEDVRADALNNIGAARTNLGVSDGTAELEESIEILERLGSVQALRGYNNLAHALIEAGELDRALDVNTRGVASGERFGYAEWLLWLNEKRAQLLFHAGRWDEALVVADEYLAKIEAAGETHYVETSYRDIRAQILGARGDRGTAVAESERSVETARRVREGQMYQPTLSFAVTMLLDVGERERAAELFDELLASLGEVLGLRSVYWSYAAEAARELGRTHELLPLLGGDVRHGPWVAAAVAIANDDLARAADTARGIGSPPLEARIRTQLAEELLASGRRAEGEDQLLQALALWRSLGATTYITQGEALLEVAS